jgi:DNA invertase Pin-like site-specific DNA recombinase
MKDARKRRFDAVLVWKLDRFGRSLKHLVNALAEFQALGISFISYKESLDMTTPAGRLCCTSAIQQARGLINKPRTSGFEARSQRRRGVGSVGFGDKGQASNR